MSKQSKSAKSLPRNKGKGGPCEAPAMPLKDRNLAAVSPLREQFEPTPAAPIRQRARMGGTA